MAGKKLEYEVKVDASDATSELKKVGEAGEKAGKQLVDGFKDAGSKSEAAFDKVIAGLKDVTTESKRTIETVDKIGAKFGEGFDPQATAQLVNSLRKAGVEFDTIEQRADELAATMRELQDVRIDAGGGLKQVGDEAHAAGGHVGELSDSARGANSALANMIGNSAQDMGALGGVAGSAGVAIGQMAEYAADAALGGEALGASLKSMATVAGPIAALSAAMLALQGIMKLIHRDDGLTAAQVAAVTEALADQIGVLDDYQAAVSEAFGQGTADTIEVFTEAVLKSIEATKGDEFIAGLESALGRLGVVRQQFGEIAAESQEEQAAFFRSLLNLHGVIGPLQTDLADYYTGLGFGTDATAEWARQNPELAASFLAVSDALGEARKNNNAATQDFLDRQAQINDGTKALINAAIATAAAQATATGAQFNWNDALKAYIQLQQQIAQIGGAVVTVTDQQAEAEQAAADALEEQTDAMAEAIAKAKEMTLAVGDLTESIAEINADDLGNLASGFKDALDAAGDLSNFKFRVDFDEAMSGADGFIEKLSGEFKPDILELAAFIRNNLNIGNQITWGELKSDDPEFAALVVDMTSMIKEGAAKAYAVGGEEAAHQFVQSQAEALAKAVPGLTTADVYRLVGLPADGSLDAIIQPIIDAEAKSDALATLDALAGVDPDNPIIARIKLGVQTGTIDPVIAEIAALILAGQYGVDVKPQLDEFTPEQIAEAEAQIAAGGGVVIPGQIEVEPTWFNTLWKTPPEPVPIPATLTVDNAGAIDKILDDVVDVRRADIDVKADNAGKIGKLIDAVADKARPAEITATPVNFNVVDIQLDQLAMPSEDGRLAHIFAQPTNVANADAALDGVAHHRNAQISVRADNAGQVDNILDNVANPGGQPRYADIYVRTHNTVITTPGGTGGGPTPVPDLAPAGFAAGDDVGINPLAGDASVVSFGSPVSVSGASFAPTVHNHVTIQAAVIGSRFDVQRAVSKALRQAQRLNGVRV